MVTVKVLLDHTLFQDILVIGRIRKVNLLLYSTVFESARADPCIQDEVTDIPYKYKGKLADS
jgi:hypothetical protein